MILIHVQNISKTVRGGAPLDGVSLDIPEGIIVGVFGRNGSGKSLLLRCMVGMEQPDRGKVSVSKGVRSSLALQKPGLAPELTLGENLALFTSLGHVPLRRRTNRVAHLLQDFGLSEYKNTPAGALPLGVLARAEIARAFCAESHVIMIDGLLDMLDHLGLEMVWKVIYARRREEGTAFVIATARGEVAGRCNLLALLDKGSLLASGTPAELKKDVSPEVIVVDGVRSPVVKSKIRKRFAAVVEDSDGRLRFSSAEGVKEVAEILAEHGPEAGVVYLKQPGLEDVLEHYTARRSGDE